MKHFKQLVAFALTLCLLVGYIPTTTVATGVTEDPVIMGITARKASHYIDQGWPFQAFDGNLNTRWCSNGDSGDQGWLVFSLPYPAFLSRMVVEHAEGYNGGQKMNNTVAFSLQRLNPAKGLDIETMTKEQMADDANWITVVDVDNNAQLQKTDTVFTSEVSAQHYRLNVTDGDACPDWSAVRIHEVWLYGVRDIEGRKKITFDAGGGTGTMDPDYIMPGETYTLPECSYGPTGNQWFDGWSVKVGQADPVIRNTGETIVITEDTVATALWKDIQYYTVSYDAGGGQGTKESFTIEEGNSLFLPDNPFTPTGDRRFIGWNVKVGDAEPVFKVPSDVVDITADIVLIAVWEDIVRYTVSFEGGGARGTMEAQSHAVYTGDYTVPVCGFTTPTAMTFAGWKIKGDTSDKVYAQGDRIPLTGDITLVARWYSAEGAQILHPDTAAQQLNAGGTYIVTENFNIFDKIAPQQNLTLIVEDGATLTLNNLEMKLSQKLTVGGGGTIHISNKLNGYINLTGGYLHITGILNPDRFTQSGNSICQNDADRTIWVKGTIGAAPAGLKLYDQSWTMTVQDALPGNFENNGVIHLPQGFDPAEIAKANLTGTGCLMLDGVEYRNDGTRQWPVKLHNTIHLTNLPTLPEQHWGGTDLSFAAMTADEGYLPKVSYRIGTGEETVIAANADGTYTIPGSAITGDLTVIIRAISQNNPEGFQPEVLEKLDFVADPTPRGNLQEEGYHWDGKVLTVNGLNLRAPEYPMLVLPADSEIDLQGPGRLVPDSPKLDQKQLQFAGNLTIRGSYPLEVCGRIYGTEGSKNTLTIAQGAALMLTESSVDQSVNQIHVDGTLEAFEICTTVLKVSKSGIVKATKNLALKSGPETESLVCGSLSAGTLDMGDGVKLTVDQGGQVQIKSTARIKGSLTVKYGTAAIGKKQLIYGGTRTFDALTVPADMQYTFAPGSQITVTGPMVNNGTIENYGTLNVPDGYQNPGTLLNYGVINGQCLDGSPADERTQSVTYLDENGTEVTVTAMVLDPTKPITMDGWYFVKENMTLPQQHCTAGDVKLILGKGTELTLDSNNYTTPVLSVYTQTGGTPGILNVVGGQEFVDFQMMELRMYSGTLHGTNKVLFRSDNCGILVSPQATVDTQLALTVKGHERGETPKHGLLYMLSDDCRATFRNLHDLTGYPYCRGIVTITNFEMMNGELVKVILAGGKAQLTEADLTGANELWLAAPYEYTTEVTMPAGFRQLVMRIEKGAYGVALSYRDASGTEKAEVIEPRSDSSAIFTLPETLSGTVTLKTYSFSKAAVAEAPTEKASLVYNGSAQALVNPGRAANGLQMEYRLGSNGTWSTAVPEVLKPDTYDVQYRVQDPKGNEKTGSVSVTIAKLSAQIKADDASVTYKTAAPAEFTYQLTGILNKDLCLVAGTPSFSTAYQSGDWDKTFPIRGALGGFDPEGKLREYYDLTFADGTLTIVPADYDVTPPLPYENLTYNGQPQKLFKRGWAGSSDANMYYSFDRVNWSTNIPKPVDAGTYKIWYKLLAQPGYNEFVSEKPLEITISKVDISDASAATAPLTYNGTVQTPEVTLTKDGLTCEFTAAAPESWRAGDYTLTLTGTGNFQGTQEISYTIAKRKISMRPKPQTIRVGKRAVQSPDMVIISPPGFMWQDTLAEGDVLAEVVLYGYNLVPSDHGNLSINDYTIKRGAEDVTDCYNVYCAQGDLKVLPGIPYLNSEKMPVLQEGWTYDGQTRPMLSTAAEGIHGTVWYRYSVNGEVQPDTVTVPDIKDAGTYQVSYYLKGDENYEDTAPVELGSFTVSPREVTLSWSGLEFNFDGSAHVPTATVTNAVKGDTVTVTVTGEQSNAGTYTVAASGLSNANYTLPTDANTQFTIKAVNTGYTAPTAAGFTYDGQTHALLNAGSAVHGTVEYSMEKNGAYTTQIPTAKDAGDYTVWYRVKAEKNYLDVDPQSVTIKVEKKDISGAVITLGDALTYNGAEQTQTITSVTADSLPVTYTVSGNTGTDAGDYALTIVGTGNFTGTASKTWKIAKATPMADQFTASEITHTYDGKAHQPVITLNSGISGMGTVTVNTSATLVSQSAPEISFSVAEGKNYLAADLTVAQAFTIQPREVTLSWSDLEFNFDGNPHKPTATVTNALEGDTVTVTVTGEQTNAGTHTAAASSLSSTNYSLPASADVQFTIRAIATGYVAPTAAGFTYDGQAHALLNAGSAEHGTMEYSMEKTGVYTTEIPTATDAGTYTVWYRVTADQNYLDVAPQSVTVKVEQKDISAAVITLGDSLTYNGKAQTQSITSVKVDELAVTYTVTGSTGTNADTYTMTFTGNGNFTGSVTKSFTIAPHAMLDLTAEMYLVRSVPNYRQTLNLSDIPGYPGDAGTGPVIAMETPSLGANTTATLENGTLKLVADNTAANTDGSVVINLTDMQNYADSTITVTVKYTDKTPVTISGITVVNREYNGKPVAYTGTPAAKAGNQTVKPSGYTYTWLDADGSILAEAPTNAGTYKLVVAVKNTDTQYKGSVTIPVTIQKAVVTVTAENKSAHIGSDQPANTYKVSGLFGNDQLTGTVTFTDNGDMSRAGTYTITPAGGNAGANYTIAYKAGTLTVEDHSWNTQWSKDETNHWHECSVCHVHKDEAAHTWKTPEFVFAADGKTATAKTTCECGQLHEETAAVTYKITTPATCTEKGTTTYTAKVTLNGTEYTGTATRQNVVIDPTYHNQQIVKVDAKAPTCTESGVKEHYKCTGCGKLYSNVDGLTEITLEEVTIKATGHKWSKPVITFSENGKTATAVVTCENDKAHTQKLDVKVTSQVKTPATKEIMGTTTYTAAAIFEGKTYTATKDVQDIPKVKPAETVEKVETEKLTEVPESLKETPYNTVEKIEKAMEKVVLKKISEQKTDNEQKTIIFDASLMITENGITRPATKEEVEARGGITIVIPYPAGTNKDDFVFTVAHMLTMDMAGMRAGDIEMPEITLTEKGLKVTLKGLSPVMVGYSKKAEEKVPETTEPAKPATPATGDNSQPVIWIGIMALAVIGIVVVFVLNQKNKKKNKN